MREPESVRRASSSSTFSSSTAPSTMAPEKKSGTLAHPSTSKAPLPAASYAVVDAGARGDVDAARGVVGAGGTVTASPAADTGARALQGVGKGVTPSAPPPLVDEHSCSNGVRSGASHRPPVAPTTGAAAAHAPFPELAYQAAALNGAIDLRANCRATPLPRWSSHSSMGAVLPLLSPSGARRRCGRHHRHPCQAQPQRLWLKLSCC